MIVDCPNCAKTYSLPRSITASPSVRLGSPLSQQYGWSLSCASCNHKWWQVAKRNFPLTNKESLVQNSFSPSFPGSFKAAERTTTIVKRKKSAILSFLSIFIVMLSLGCVGYLYKQPLRSAWSQLTGRPIAMSALPLIFQNVRYNLSIAPNPADDSQTLTIEGIILNPNTLIMDAPVLRISVWADCQGKPSETKSSFNDCLYLEWLYRPTVPQIDGLGALPFETSYSVSAKITRVEVSIP